MCVCPRTHGCTVCVCVCAPAHAREHSPAHLAQELIRRQDETAADLEAGVRQLGEAAGAIREELREQDVMLDDLGQDVSKAQGAVDRATKELQKLLKTKGGRV